FAVRPGSPRVPHPRLVRVGLSFRVAIGDGLALAGSGRDSSARPTASGLGMTNSLLRQRVSCPKPKAPPSQGEDGAPRTSLRPVTGVEFTFAELPGHPDLVYGSINLTRIMQMMAVETCPTHQ